MGAIATPNCPPNHKQPHWAHSTIPTFTWTVALDLLLRHGPTAVIWGQKIYSQIQAGRAQTVVTDADIAELVAYGRKTPDDYLREVGITPPPAP